MTAMTLWSSKSRLENVRHQMERIWQEMDQALGGVLPVPMEHVFSKGDFLPPIEVFTKDEAVIVKIELPGFVEKELNLVIDERQLQLSGERKREEELDVDGYHHSERFYGKFSRQILLPASVDFEKAEATFVDGMLTVRAPLKKVVEQTVKKLVISK